VPGATITATETRTNISRTTTSNNAGNYTFTNPHPASTASKRSLRSFQEVPPGACRAERQYDGARGDCACPRRAENL
jgi:hypothetical protein